MGIFKKMFKGVKKVFKKIGSGIKKVVKKVGKFAGKLGIVGQIGLGLLLPGIGTMFGQLAGAMMNTTLTGISGAIVKGAGSFINAAVNVGTKVGNVFKTITEGVGRTIGELTGATLNKIPGASNVIKSVTGGKIDIGSKTFTSAWKTTQDAFTQAAGAGRDLFSMDTLTADNVFMPKVEEAVVDQVDYTKYDPATGDTYVDQPAQVMPEQPATSLLDKAKETAASIPERLTSATISQVAAIPRDIVRGMTAPTPEMTYNVSRSYVPDLMGQADIGAEAPQFDVASYWTENQATFDLNPFGHSARIWNAKTYEQTMADYGYRMS